MQNKKVDKFIGTVIPAIRRTGIIQKPRSKPAKGARILFRQALCHSALKIRQGHPSHSPLALLPGRRPLSVAVRGDNRHSCHRTPQFWRTDDVSRYLRETLKMANSEDLNRLTSCSLVLLGHIFLSLGNSRESMNMVTPAMQLASKIPDVHVQLWASAILKDLYRICGDPNRESEAYQMHCNLSQTLLKDHFQSTQMVEHALIQWTDGPIPALPSNPPPSTSQAILERIWSERNERSRIIAEFLDHLSNRVKSQRVHFAPNAS